MNAVITFLAYWNEEAGKNSSEEGSEWSSSKFLPKWKETEPRELSESLDI